MEDYEEKVRGIPITTLDLDAIIRGRRKMDLSDLPPNAKLKRVFYDGFRDFLVLIYEHESFKEIGRFGYVPCPSSDIEDVVERKVETNPKERKHLKRQIEDDLELLIEDNWQNSFRQELIRILNSLQNVYLEGYDD